MHINFSFFESFLLNIFFVTKSLSIFEGCDLFFKVYFNVNFIFTKLLKII